MNLFLQRLCFSGEAAAEISVFGVVRLITKTNLDFITLSSDVGQKDFIVHMFSAEKHFIVPTAIANSYFIIADKQHLD